MRLALYVVLEMDRDGLLGVLKEGVVSNTSTYKNQTNKMTQEISASNVIETNKQILDKQELSLSTKYHLISSTTHLAPSEVMVNGVFGTKIQSQNTKLPQR